MLADSCGAVSGGPDACRRGAAALISLVVRWAGVVAAELGGIEGGRTCECQNNKSLWKIEQKNIWKKAEDNLGEDKDEKENFGACVIQKK